MTARRHYRILGIATGHAMQYGALAKGDFHVQAYETKKSLGFSRKN
jgi:hypothetical protein